MVEKSPSCEAPQIVIDSNPLTRAAELLTQALSGVLQTSSAVRLAIPGGSALAAVPIVRSRLGEAWGRVTLTWVDERCVDFENEESNRGAAARLGLFGSMAPSGFRDTGANDPERLLPLFENGETPEQAVSRVALGFRELFSNAIDVALLGMGTDGHVASLFPPVPAFDGRMIAHVADSPKPPGDRITLTRRALETAATVVLLATGEPKRDALKRLVAGDSTLPAQGLPGLIVVTDLDLE